MSKSLDKILDTIQDVKDDIVVDLLERVEKLEHTMKDVVDKDSFIVNYRIPVSDTVDTYWKDKYQDACDEIVKLENERGYYKKCLEDLQSTIPTHYSTPKPGYYGPPYIATYTQTPPHIMQGNTCQCQNQGSVKVNF